MRPNNLPFQYLMRGQQLQYLDGDALAHAIDQRDRDLEDYLGGVWRALPLINLWVNYDVTTFPEASYRKVGDIVYLRGLIRSGTIPGTIATLPAGFRPPRIVHVPVSSNDAYGQVRVDMGGVIYAGTGSNVWLDLASVQFSVTP